jgi:acyl dehydratase
MQNPPQVDDLHVGYRFSLQRAVEPGDVRRSVEFARDYGGYHVDEAFARAAGFRTVITSGIYHHALMAEAAGRMHLLGRETSLRMRAPIYERDVLSVTAEVVELQPERRLVTLAIAIVNQDGAPVADCRVTGYLPSAEWGLPAPPAGMER